LHIDHVIYATGDLDVAAAAVEAQLGVAAFAGGRHDGQGTHNRIVPLGAGYLELLAVCDAEEARTSQFGAALAARIAQVGEGLMGWAVGVADVQPVAARLGTAVMTVGRQGRVGRLTGVLESLRDPFLPFFIQRDPAGRHGDPDAIGWIEVAGDGARLARWLGGATLPVRVAAGAAAVRAIGVGDRELRT
jgi:glyoxalase-like protein